MAGGTVVFQTAVTATPPNALAIMADSVNDSDHGAGTAQYIKIMDGATAGTAKAAVTTANGLAVDVTRVQGTVQLLGTLQPLAGSVHPAAALPGTSHITGTVQPLAGSVHPAAALPGTSHITGTVQLIGTVPLGTIAGTVQVIGTVQLHGTNQALGTMQPLAGSIHPAAIFFGSVQGWQSNDGAAAGNPVLIGVFGSSGTQAAVGDGDVVRLWSDLNGRLQVRGTIDSLPDVSGTVQTHGTSQVLGSVQGVGTFQSLGTVQPLAGSVHLASRLPGTADIGTIAGTVSILGTLQPLAGSVHLATNLAGGTIVAVGSAVHGAAADTRPLLLGGFGSSGTQAAVDDGDAVRAWFDLNGRLQIRGTIDSMPAIAIGTISGGTIQAFGTTEVLGTVRALTTVDAVIGTIQEGTINSFGGTIGGGTIQIHGTAQVLGTTQPLAGSVHVATNLAGGTVVVVGSVAHGVIAGAAMRPLLMAGVGSSGTQAAVGDGSVAQLWTDVNGRLQVRGTIDSMPTVTVQATNLDIRDLSSASDSVAVVGTVQPHGTSEVLGTVQAVSTMLFGSVQGWQAHDGAAAGNPLLMGAFGSSGTQAAVGDGDAVRLWADNNGRLQIRGTIDSMPAVVITSGTVSLQTGGTIHVGSVQSVAGTVQALGTTQPLAGSVHLASALPGTVAVGTVGRVAGTVLTRPNQVSEGFFGTRFTGAVTNGTLVPAPASGTYVRVWGMVASGSAAGTAFFELGDGTIFGAIFTAANGGMVYNSAKGIRTNGTAQDIFFNCAAGTWGVSVEYTLENA